MAYQDTNFKVNDAYCIVMWGDDHFRNTVGSGDVEASTKLKSVTSNFQNNTDGNYSLASSFLTTHTIIRLPLYPDEISDSISASWQTQDILGRSAPVSSYMSTNFREVSFNFTLHRELLFNCNSYLKNVKGRDRNIRGKNYSHINTTEEILSIMRLACYPVYVSNGLMSPVVCFRFGEFFCKGYMESVSYTWKKPIIDNKYMVCDVSIGPIHCYPKSILAGSAPNVYKEPSLDPYGNTFSPGSYGKQQGGW